MPSNTGFRPQYICSEKQRLPVNFVQLTSAKLIWNQRQSYVLAKPMSVRGGKQRYVNGRNINHEKSRNYYWWFTVFHRGARVQSQTWGCAVKLLCEVKKDTDNYTWTNHNAKNTLLCVFGVAFRDFPRLVREHVHASVTVVFMHNTQTSVNT